MNFTNCKRCKTIFKFEDNFSQNRKKFCPKCIMEILNEISLLCSTISENDEITLLELSEKTRISESTIKNYISVGKVPNVKDFEMKTFKKYGLK